MIARTFKHYPLTMLCGMLIILLCLIWVPPHPPRLETIFLIDKWAHILMFGGTMAVWCWERRKRTTTLHRMLWAFVCATAFGGLIEVAQDPLTATRSADFMDLLADAIGAATGLLAGRYIVNPLWFRLTGKKQ